MAKNLILDKLEGVKSRFEEVGRLITQPDIINDMKKYVKLNKEYKVKNKELAPLFIKVYNLTLGFKKVKFKHVPREMNKEADRLANEAMDKRE